MEENKNLENKKPKTTVLREPTKDFSEKKIIPLDDFSFQNYWKKLIKEKEKLPDCKIADTGD